jgi:hypothetical protein
LNRITLTRECREIGGGVRRALKEYSITWVRVDGGLSQVMAIKKVRCNRIDSREF